MRMIESVDSVVTRSSEDLWAEICSCLPHPEHKDAGDAFTDSFMDSYAEGSGSGGSSQPALKPWAPLKDSEVYLASLGECLPGDSSVFVVPVLWSKNLPVLIHRI